VIEYLLISQKGFMMKTLIITSLFFLFSCAMPTKQEVKNQSILGNWQVTNIQNVAIPLEVNSHFNFQMEEKLNGNTSCNNFFANYKLNGTNLLISSSGTTKRLCFGKLNNYEFIFLQSLTLVDHYKIERNYLTLFNKEGKMLFKANRN
jgi:heat shock protein HslJ